MHGGSARRAGLGWLVALVALVAAAGAAQEPAAEPVQLDRLLELPAGQSYGVDRRGGLSRGEWKSRYSEVHKALETERSALAAAQTKLDEVAGTASNWQVAPIPGMEPSPDAPLDYQLRFRIRQHKSEIERLEKKLRALDIEANLAGVPEDWRS